MSSRSRIPPSNVPVFQIDMDLPPRDRYKALALEYKSQIATITPLFNELLHDMGIPVARHDNINTLARWMLRGVYSDEETEELRGISDVTGVAMYLLAALNVVLDLLMGCTSSVVRSNTGGYWHLRTLDWAMDPLRRMVVQLDFIRGKHNPGEVIARSLTYVGFVGVLTGVRPNLSMSLNFRAVHNADTRWGQFRFYTHHLAVLLGLRPSISSILRQCLLSSKAMSLDQIEAEISVKHTTAAYLTFSDGRHALVLEKDFCTAEMRRDVDGFVVATNHDVSIRKASGGSTPTVPAAVKTPKMQAMHELVEDSEERTFCVTQKWNRHLRSTSLRDIPPGISGRDAIRWISDWPTTNETTHFAVVMDPSGGRITWARAYHEAIHAPASHVDGIT